MRTSRNNQKTRGSYCTEGAQKLITNRKKEVDETPIYSTVYIYNILLTGLLRAYPEKSA